MDKVSEADSYNRGQNNLDYSILKAEIDEQKTYIQKLELENKNYIVNLKLLYTHTHDDYTCIYITCQVC